MSDFGKTINRRDTSSLKWDVGNRELPMWVADMDFEVAFPIKEALLKRVEHGVFGYNIIGDAWYLAYQNWYKDYYDLVIDRDWLIFSTGIVPAISSMVRRLTLPNENVVMLTPIFNVFFNCVVNNGARVLESELVYEKGEYHIDFVDLEAKLSNPQTSLMILCNPHNPIGKIWDRDTLARIGELCAKYHVVVIADEVHGELCDPNRQYVPFSSVNELNKMISISCFAVSKTFNLAGLQSGAIMVADPFLRHRVNRGLNTDEVAECNSFMEVATVAALNEGREWLAALREVIYRNKNIVRNFLEEHLPKIHLVQSEATYLLWLDISAYGIKSDELCELIRNKSGLVLSDGVQFGGNGSDFVRMNIACNEETLMDGLNRLLVSLKDYQMKVYINN